MIKTYCHTVPDLSERMRCSEYLIGVFPGLETKSAVKKALKESMITVDGKIALSGTWITGGESITCGIDSSKIMVWEKKIRVYYEDDHLAIVEKPAGIPTSGNQFKNLRNALPFNLIRSQEKDSLVQPEPIHRLDTATSGLVVIAKTWQARRILEKKLQYRGITKKYFALVHGQAPSHGWVDNPLNNKSALTQFETISILQSALYGTCSLLSVTLHTGRTHQIRIHLAEIGFPILGDKLYNNLNSKLARGLILHAFYLSFYHPINGEKLFIQTPLPKRIYKRIYPKFKIRKPR
jgi:RluA family pseudouridine synthase